MLELFESGGTFTPRIADSNLYSTADTYTFTILVNIGGVREVYISVASSTSLVLDVISSGC